MPRNYDKEPVEVTFNVKMFFYEKMPADELSSIIQRACNNASIQEQVFDAFQLYDNAGLAEITAQIIVPPSE